MDMGLRKLMQMSDPKIRADVLAFRKMVSARMKTRKGNARLETSAAGESSAERAGGLDRRSSPGLLPPRHIAAVIHGVLRPIRIRAIVRFTGNRSDLEHLGITVRSQAQDVFTITATKTQLAQLAAQPACHRLRIPRFIVPTVEQASGQAEIAAVHDPRPLNPTGFRGNGILIGIIDTCLDVTHHGFRDPGGTNGSRVLYYWAQSPFTLNAAGSIVLQNPPGQTPDQFSTAHPGTSPNFGGLSYGRIYDTAAIDAALALANPYGTANNQVCCQPANAEHGTHCAGIAAGSGHVANWATAPTHVGAAPQATIIFVALQLLGAGALDSGTTFEDSLLDGIDFCLRAAQFHNLPIVISVSQGSNWGPHNGSSDFDLARDNFLNSFDRRSIVFAAGNDNDVNGYRRGSVAPGNTVETFSMTFRRANNCPGWLDVWYSGPELDYRIGFGGSNSGWRTAGQDFTGNVGGRHFEAERDIEAGGGLKGIRIYVEQANMGEVYTIELRNPHATDTADYRAWTGLQGWWADLTGPTVDETTLGDTGCGRSILTVGACAKVVPPNPASGETITAYSGAGPTVDGRIKPEIVAVGGEGNVRMVISTNSDQNSGYVGKGGTSMATPLVAGAAALLLEAYENQYTLNQDTIKALLTQHTNRLNLHVDPTQPGYVATERNRYGYGRLRLIGPIDEIVGPLDVDVWIRTADDDYGQEPYPGGCFCGSPDIRVFQEGTANETTNINWGTTYDVRVTVRNLGTINAVGATLRLKYALPWTAPNAWFEAEDAGNNKLVQTVDVPAMDQHEVLFKWRPEAAELSAPAGTTHFCLLAEVDHAADPLVFPAPTTAGGDAWSSNIKGTNNVALRNLHIQ
jgi:subtilisin family serine protease